MAGFFGRLFNRNQSDDSYFLDPDTAKTLGDINYMRKTAKIKHTFPKTKEGEGGEIILEVSSIDKKEIAETTPSASPASPTFNETKFEPKVPERRTAKDSNSMDMFRKMAKDIRKPQ